MKKLTFIFASLFILFSIGTTFGNNPENDNKGTIASKSEAKAAVVLKGVVIDDQTNESLTGVALEINGTNLTVYTDFDGNFTINNIEPGYYNIIVNYVSYQPHLLENVYIQQGENTLQPIKLKAN